MKLVDAGGEGVWGKPEFLQAMAGDAVDSKMSMKVVLSWLSQAESCEFEPCHPLKPPSFLVK